MAMPLPHPVLPGSAWIVYVASRTVEVADLPAPSGRVILIEPAPSPGGNSHAAETGKEPIRLAGALGRSGDRALYRLYNQPILNGFSEPTGAIELYPGLRERHRVAVREITAGTLRDLSPERVPGEALDMLVIEIVGEGKPLIEWLADNDLLDRFGTIWLRSARSALCVDDAKAEDAMEWLETLGFAVRAYPGHEDPDLLWITANRRPPSAELLKLRHDVETLRHDGHEDQAKLLEMRERCEKVQGQLEKSQQESVALRSELESLRQGLHQVRQALDTSRQESAALRNELRAECLLRAIRDVDLEHLRRLYRGLPKDLSGRYQLPEQLKFETDPS